VKRFHILILAVFLVFIGLGLFIYKAAVLRYPLFPDEEVSRWVVEAHISYLAKNTGVTVKLRIPEKKTQGFLVVEENFVERGYGVRTLERSSGSREVLWTKRKAVGLQGLYYRAVVSKSEDVPEFRGGAVPVVRAKDMEPIKVTAMNAIIEEARERSNSIESLVVSLISQLQLRSPNVKLICGSKNDAKTKASCAVMLLQEAGLVAREVHGVYLKNATGNATIVHKVQVLDNKKWITFDPEKGGRFWEESFLPWWYGKKDLLDVPNVGQAKVEIAIQPIQVNALDAAGEYAREVAPSFADFSLFSLPVDTQRVYRVLLLVPVGAMLVVLLRNVVGFVTFGTFMPVLIGIAFRETEMWCGVVLFSMLVGIGLAARFYLERLKLLLVPRLSAVLIVVVMIMAFSSVLTFKLGIERGISVALFPMVIITMTIERMSIVWDELGAGVALKQGLGTLIVSCAIYCLVCNSIVEHIIFVFPELLFVVLAFTILMGRYSGYRLFEIKRFRALAASKK